MMGVVGPLYTLTWISLKCGGQPPNSQEICQRDKAQTEDDYILYAPTRNRPLCPTVTDLEGRIAVEKVP